MTTYSWNSGLGSGQTKSPAPNVTTVYQVTVTDGNSCSATAQTTITVNTPPVASISITETSGNVSNDAITCSGDNASLTANPAAMLSYVWNNGLNSNQTNVVNPTATTAYNVTVTNLNNCSASATNTVTVNPLPTPTISVTESSGVANNDGITCSGAAVGLLANPAGQVAYVWSNGLGSGASKSASPTTTTTYTVTVTNANNCSAPASTTITVNQYPVFGTPPYVVGNVLCNGGNSGDITINGSTSNSPLIYSIDNGAAFRAGNFFDSLTVGNYNLVIRDNANCQTSYSGNPVVITQPTPLSHTTVKEDASCANVFDGKITITSAGGVTPYRYSLNNGPLQSGNVFSGLASGTYDVATVDANNCEFHTTVILNNSYGIDGAILSQTDVGCFGDNDGSVTVMVTLPGIAPYSFSINGVSFVQPGTPFYTFTGLAAGTYTATIRDSKGCTAFVPVTIAQPAVLQAQIDSIQNILCNGGTTGGIFITAVGGTPGYDYLWSNGSTNEDITNIPAGTYNVIVRDAAGCSTSVGATITQPLPLFLTVASANNLRCFNDSTGNIDVTVSGGVPPYSFVWSNGATTEDISGLHAGTYGLTITDNNGCQQTISRTITEPVQLSATKSVTNVLCNGASTGSIDITPAGGTTPYSYLWSNGATTQDVTAIPAATYTAVITDANGCSISNTTVITQPAALTLSTVVTNISCTGNSSGAINLTVSGGAGSYTYAWTGGATTEDISGLAPGTYTVTVTDGNLCTATASGTITQPSQAITGNTVSTDVTCNGAANGTVNLTVTGGVQPYSFLWSNNATSEDLTGLVPGTYSVTATDNNGCTFTTSVVIAEPAVLTATIVPTNVTCFGGSNGVADLTVTGGNPGYTYLWNTFATTQDLNGVGAGNYVVIVNDTKNCQTIQTVTITQPAQIVITGVVSNIPCNGGTGSVDISVTGGTGAYTYAWTGGGATQDTAGLVAGTYTVTVTDANSCTATATYTLTQPQPVALSGVVTNVTCNGAANGAVNLTVSGGNTPYTFVWSNGPTTEDITGLSGNTYTVTVNDANSCSAVASFVVAEPTAIVSSIVGTNVTCSGANNGAADLTVSGGTLPYTYLWSNFQSTQDLSNIGGGTYFVIITDANGCQKRDSVVITEQQSLVLSTVVANVACNGANTGSINLTVTGGNGVYTYQWTGGGATQDTAGLVAGSYSVTVTDGNGCSAVTSATVTQPTALVLNATTTNVACSGGANGSIDITIQGGVFPYTFAWSNGPTTEDVNGLSGGSYSVTVTDANGCTITATYTITEAVSIVSSIAGTNVTCYSASNGAANLSVSGGTIPYTYLWSNFQGTQDLSNIGGGLYYVIITDANGCQKRDSILITEPNALVLTTVVTNVACNGANTGAINLSVTGGTGAYSYAWTGGGATQDTSGLVAGTYTVTVTDGNNCTATASATITQPTALVLNATTTNVGCAGGANGSVDITVQGGVFPYTFAWSNGAITEDVNGLSGGSYSVTVTDANGCTITATYTITEANPITSSIAGTNVTCNGASNGAADLTVSGGALPYNYLWSNFQGTQDLSNIGGGLYYVIITDANGCQKRDSILITEPSALVLTTVVTNVACNGANTGEIDLSVTGGTGAYTYTWTGGGATQDTTGLLAGTYTVTVTDGNNCTATASATVTQPAGMVLNATTSNVGCAGGANGSVDVTVQGGVFPYTFAWSNGAVTEDINGLSGGTYSITITDANGCTITATYTITEPAAITTSIVGTNVTCNGASNGAADLTVSGGTAPYTYFWSNFAATQDLANIGGGTYFVIVTDVNGCQKRDSIIITEPSALVLTTVVTNVLCNGGNTGAVDLTVTGGTGVYTYAWTGGATTQDINGLTAGTYTVTVTDNTCTATASVVITQPTAIVLNATTTNVGCAGGANGSVDITVQGGVFPYTFAWSNGEVTDDINALSGGTYSVTVTDANLCTVTATYTITEPSALTSSISGTNVNCFGGNNGAADLTVGGGTTPYTYLWSNFFSSQDLANLTAGTYFVIIKDANGCEKRDSVVITQPAQIVLTTSVTNVLCNGALTGAIDLTVTGGVAPYDYSWSSGQATQDLTGVAAGTYTVTVKDANNCTATATATITQPTALVLTGTAVNVTCFGGNNGQVNTTVVGGVQPYTFAWSNGASTEDISNLTAGTYTLTVTDNNGCSATATYTLTAPTAITSSIVTTNVLCNGANNGAANLTVSGGTPGYSFQWSNFQISEDATGLGGGVYYVIITDAAGCTHRDSAIISEPAELVLSTQATQISCFNANNGSIDLTVAGGTTPYQYSWSNGATTPDISNLSGNTYCVTVTDNNGCTSSTCVLIINPSSISTNAVINNPVCNGDQNGSIDVIVAGGTPNYTFNWSTGATSEDISNLVAGVYSLTITDARGCVQIDTFNVTEPSALFTSGFIRNVTCFGNNDGCVDITAYGGTLPYTYTWSTGQSTEDICNLSGGNYFVTVTDAHGCSVVSLYIVSEPAQLTLNVTGTNISCFGGKDGTLTAFPAGGTTPYEYLWDDFNTDSSRISVDAGLHVLMLTDSNGCHVFDSITLTQPQQIVITGVVSNALCFNAANGGINITVAGGVGPYTYLWSNGSTSEDLTAIAAGVYTVTVTDANGCTSTASFTVDQPDQIYLTLLTSKPTCNGASNGSLSVVATAGVVPYTYAWNTTPVQTTASAVDLNPDYYEVTVTDANGCTAVIGDSLIGPNPIVVTTNVTGANCFNSQDGVVTTTVSGGLPPYVYQLNGVTQQQDSTTFRGLNPGTYVLLVTDANSCQGTSTFTITAPSQIGVDLVATEQFILSNMQTTLTAIVTPDTATITSIVWSPLFDSNNNYLFDFSSCGDTTVCASPKVMPKTSTTFTVTVINAQGCAVSDTITINVSNELSTFIPTGFTPNGDGLNDRFEFDILGATNLDIKIFNRWGQIVYGNATQPNGINGSNGWDGTLNGDPAPNDTYVWQMTITYFDGTTREETGTVTIMR
ncbi:MAG TPA: gliding motility-associated C-terminal domain-containing protein [Chitinophagales bacterium]|nr:gliding motility-associated C-terminal domain-containing protein [Chitinophagales bacterium]